jgi:hypothetical protein
MMMWLLHVIARKNGVEWTAVILRNRRRQHHSLELEHSRVDKRKQNTRGHAKKSDGADKSSNHFATNRKHGADSAGGKQFTTMERRWRAESVLIADWRHQMGPMICHSLDFEVSVYKWPRVTQTSLRLRVCSPGANNVTVLFHFV